MNEWNKLCEECLNIIEEAKMTDKEIDDIVEQSRI